MFDDDDDNDKCTVLVDVAAKSSSSDDCCVKQYNFYSKNEPVCGKSDMGKHALKFVIHHSFIDQLSRNLDSY